MAKTTGDKDSQTLGITFRDATDCTAFKVVNQFSGTRVQIGYKVPNDWTQLEFIIDTTTASIKQDLQMFLNQVMKLSYLQQLKTETV